MRRVLKLRPALNGVLLLWVAGCASPATTRISASGAGAYEAGLTATASGFAVAWYDTRDGRAAIYARMVESAGGAPGPELRLTHGEADAYEPDVQEFDGSIAVAWYEKDAQKRLRARLGLWNLQGQQLWAATLSAPGSNGRNAVVRAHHEGLFSAWIEDVDGGGSDVWAVRYDSAGAALSPPRKIARAGRSTFNLNAAIDSTGDAYVVFDALAGTRAEELFVVRVTPQLLAETQRLTPDDGVPSKYPDLAFGTSPALTWFDERDGNKEVYVAVGDLSEAGVRAGSRRVTSTPGESIGAYIAWNGARFGLAWCDDTEGQAEIYFQPITAEGVPESEPRRLTFTAAASLIPAIEPNGMGFAVAWNEYASTDGSHSGEGRSEIHFLAVP